MDKSLKSIYLDGKNRGFIRVPYFLWRIQVLMRINKLYSLHRIFMGEEEMLKFLQDGHYERFEREVERFG
jgi:hypothetical protein